MSSLDDYREVWEAPLDRYVVLNLDPEIFIFDPVSRTRIEIADIAVEGEVIKRMIERGFAVVKHLPAISTLEDYRDIWDGPLDQYAVVKEGPLSYDTFIIRLDAPRMVLIEDDAILPELLDRMIERGFQERYSERIRWSTVAYAMGVTTSNGDCLAVDHQGCVDQGDHRGAAAALSGYDGTSGRSSR